MANDTWTELKIGATGVSVSVYSEDNDGVAVLEDEIWFTNDEVEELQENGGDTFALNID